MNKESQASRSTEAAAAADGQSIRGAQRRLLIEAAIEEGYPVRLERAAGTGRTSTRIVRPVELDLTNEGQIDNGKLVTQSSDFRQTSIILDEADEVSIVTTRFRAEDERRGAWRVGGGLMDAEFGLGVVQAFREDANGVSMVARFIIGGPTQLPLERPELRPLG